MKNAVRDSSASYCGPTVIAAITGKPTSEIEDAIRLIRGRSGLVKGTTTHEVQHAFAKLGWRMVKAEVELKPGLGPTGLAEALNRAMGHYRLEPHRPRPRASTLRLPTLAAWLRKRSKEDRKATFVIEIDRHWIAVTGKKFVDTHTKGEWVWLKDAPSRRSRVRRAWKIERY